MRNAPSSFEGDEPDEIKKSKKRKEVFYESGRNEYELQDCEESEKES